MYFKFCTIEVKVYPYWTYVQRDSISNFPNLFTFLHLDRNFQPWGFYKTPLVANIQVWSIITYKIAVTLCLYDSNELALTKANTTNSGIIIPTNLAYLISLRSVSHWAHYIIITKHHNIVLHQLQLKHVVIITWCSKQLHLGKKVNVQFWLEQDLTPVH